MLTRRRAIAGSAAAALSLPATLITRSSAARGYPTRPVRAVLPGPTGGLIDIAGRAIGDVVSANLGQPLVIDARPGGNGVVAGTTVLDATRDGHTVLLTVSGYMALPYLIKTPFDVMADFAPVGMVGVSTAIFCVHPSVPANTIAELIAHAKARPGKLNYLNPGNGTGAHLVPEALKIEHGLDILSISYKGLPPGVQDLLAGRIELGVVSTSLILNHVKAGRLKAIGVLAPSRITDLPDVATLAEQGFGDIEVRSWIAFLAPARTPSIAIERLSEAVAKSLGDDAVRRRLAHAHIEPLPMSTAALGQVMQQENARLGSLIARLGIKPDGGS